MSGIVVFLMKALQITLADVVLSGDNVGIIALAIKELPEKMAKKANILGVVVAISLRILFVFLIGFLFSLEWLHIKLLGGVLLIIITFNMVKNDTSESNHKVKTSDRFITAVLSIVIADVSMSLDNVLAIASVAMNGSKNGTFGAQEIGLIIFGLTLCIPIIFFGSNIVAKLMKKHPIIIYICAAVLADTSIKMIFQDKFIASHTGNIGDVLAMITAIAVLAYGIVATYFVNKKSQ